MTKKSKNHLQWLVVAVVIVIAGLVILSNEELNLTGSQQGFATMILHFSNGRTRTFEGSTADKMTILEALYTSTESGDIRFVYSVDENNNVKIAAINDELNNIGDKQWRFYLNGKPVKTEDINKIFVLPKAAIEARFEE